MADRYDVLATRKYKSRDGEEKTSWTNVGVAFAQRDGKGFSINLHCVPVADKESGEIRLVMRVPMPRDENAGQRRGGGHDSPGYGGAGGSGDDPLPF